MKEELYHIALDDYEHGVVIRSLNDKKTDLKKEGKSTDAVDELIIKIGHWDSSRCVARLIDSAVRQGRSAGDTAEPFGGIQ